jgi:hypothetical protein
MLSTWKCPSLVRRKYHKRVNLARNGPGTLRSGDLIAEKTARSIHNPNNVGTKVQTNGQSRFDTSSAINAIEATSETDGMTARCGTAFLLIPQPEKGSAVTDEVCYAFGASGKTMLLVGWLTPLPHT